MQTYALGSLTMIAAGFLGTWCEVTRTVSNVTSSEPESVKLMYGERHGISWTDLSLDDRMPPLLSRTYMDVFGVDYHYKRNLILFTGLGAIWRLPMEEAGGEAQGELLVGGDAGATTLAVDWEHDRVYWTSPASRKVWRLDLEGQGGKRDVIIENTGNLTNHNNVVVDPYMRYLFVATNSGFSLRSDLDGDHLVRMNHGLMMTSLALDIHNRRLYVCGAWDFTPVLQSSDYDGRSVIDYKIYHDDEWWVRLVSLDVFSVSQPPQMFWVHHGWQDRDTAWRVNVSDDQLSWQKEYTVRGTVLDPENRIWCLKVCHPDVQSRPKYLESEEFLLLSSSESTTDVSAATSSSLWTRACLLFKTLSYLLLTAAFRRIIV